MSRRIVLATLGSLGDLHPFIALALRLKAHGHTPTIATSPNYLENVRAAGVNFHAIGPDLDSMMRDLKMDLSQFGHAAMRDTMFILEAAVFPYLQSMYDDLLPVIDGAALLLSSSLLYSARFAAERLDTPHMTVALQPMVIMSAYDPPAVASAPWMVPMLRKLGPRTTRAVYGQGKRLASRRAGPLHAFRRRLGLPTTASDPLFEGQFSSFGTFAVYSKLLACVQPDYPPNTLVSGFAFYDGNVAPALEPDLEEFLASGSPPLVFTLGSFAVEFADDFFRIGLEVARSLRHRAVVLTGARHREAYRTYSATDIFVGAYAPYSLLLPRALVTIHHGGIGTLGQALRAGRPQLIVPLMTDQFDNAARAVRLGVARTIARKRYTAGRVATEIQRLVEGASFAARAAEVGAVISCDQGAEQVALSIDTFLSSTRAAAADVLGEPGR